MISHQENENENQYEKSCPPTRMAKIKKTDTPNVG